MKKKKKNRDASRIDEYSDNFNEMDYSKIEEGKLENKNDSLNNIIS